MAKENETRIIPEETPPKFFAQHFKPYVFISNFVKGKKVLEIGCGDGYGAFYLSELATGVIGADYDMDSIRRAAEKYKRQNLSFIHMDAANLAFGDGSFDAVCSFQVIEHIPQDLIPRYLSEIKRVLREGGKLYLSTLNLSQAMKSPLTYKKNPAHCREFTLSQLKTLISGVFVIEKVFGLCLSLRHRFYQRLKKAGLFRFLPAAINPVDRFYRNITTEDFELTCDKPQQASDFLVFAAKE